MNKSHGMRNTRIYSIWRNMRNRCKYPSARNYSNYGGRGITYDSRWDSFEEFHKDMGESYEEGLTLDRIDVNGNYCKDNCRWIPLSEQARNKRGNYKIVYKGNQQSLIDVYAQSKSTVPYSLVYNRVAMSGWDVETALFTPVDTTKRNTRYKGDY